MSRWLLMLLRIARMKKSKYTILWDSGQSYLPFQFSSRFLIIILVVSLVSTFLLDAESNLKVGWVFFSTFEFLECCWWVLSVLILFYKSIVMKFAYCSTVDEILLLCSLCLTFLKTGFKKTVAVSRDFGVNSFCKSILLWRLD